ncbi:TonB-dependent receptor plug domain-containing protein [Elizabethkingia anophelis]|uniref:TonB-dependent receptor plug domain-containing protein n=1 Tax=Elizabethkingia anophelis TaxID=1117645 RepID=UPI0009CEFE78|nr:TonB-dependent receptor plug domain-containing protein [Elizabethkingia anophelis]OPC30738.1 hypothetical protein BAX98_09020 [Elizabethkingia anophelis]
MKNSYYTIGGIFFGLMLITVSTHLKAQTRTISGTVTSSGKPLSGVVISQEGSDQVTMTGNNGTYTLQVSAENSILLFRHPDYSEEKFTLTNQKVVNISLEQKVKGIEEVILNAGYYRVKDKERTGSIAKVSAKDIENQPVTNVLSTVQGRMAGVNITQNSGVPGGGYSIQIRGRNSLRTYANSEIDGSQPLYIVDGVPVGSGMTATYGANILSDANLNPLSNISPNDIESIEVLKDADATAIYGSRGAVDKFLEDKIKQNEQQTALAKAQADNALATANRVSQLTSFMNTTVDGNVVATGSLLVGDVVGNNAGITGVTDRGNQSVRFYAGSTYAGKNTAPFTLLENGVIKMHHGNKKIGLVFGLIDGYITLEGYNDQGEKTIVLNPQAGRFDVISLIDPYYTPIGHLTLNNNNENATTSELTTILTPLVSRNQQLDSETGLWNVFFVRNSNNYNIYSFSAGNRQVNEPLRQYEQFKYTQADYNSQRVTGWYVDGDDTHGYYGLTLQQANMRKSDDWYVSYYKDGKLIKSLTLTINKI